MTLTAFPFCLFCHSIRLASHRLVLYHAMWKTFNIADAKFRENKTSRNGENTLSFTDAGNHVLISNVLRGKYVF